MKKGLLIAIMLFLLTTVSATLLNYIINQQILSRILFGVDYNTYLTSYYSGTEGFIRLISESKMPYEQLFTFFKFIIIIICVSLEFVILRKMSTKYKLNKREFITAISSFSILSLYNVILNIVLYQKIPSANFFTMPIIFIITTIIALNKYLKEKIDN